MFDIQVDDRVIVARLDAMPTKVHAALLKKTYTLAQKLTNKVKQNLTNRILRIRTGRLARSIFPEVKDAPGEVSGRVYSSGLPYARIQEFGGQTKAHVIEATKALAFNWNGKQMFFRHVNHPGSKIAAARYMGQAFDEMKPEIKSGYEQAVKGAMRE